MIPIVTFMNIDFVKCIVVSMLGMNIEIGSAFNSCFLNLHFLN